MSLKGTLEASFAIRLIGYMYKLHSSIAKRIGNIYHQSKTHNFATNFCKVIKICTRHSSLGKASGTKHSCSLILYSSKSVRSLIDLYSNWLGWINVFQKSSLAIKAMKKGKDEFYSSTTKILGYIIVYAVCTNIILSVFFRIRMYLWNWIILVLFSFVGLVSIFSPLNWKALRDSSIFLKDRRTVKDVRKNQDYQNNYQA